MCLSSEVSSRGLAVKAEDKRLRGCGFKPPHSGDHSSCSIHMDQEPEQKVLMESSNLPGIVACALVLLMKGCSLRNAGV